MPVSIPPLALSQGKLIFTSAMGRILSHRLRDLLSWFSINVDLVDLKEYVPEDLPKESFVLIVASLEKERMPSPCLQIIAQLLSKKAVDLNQPNFMEACRFGIFVARSRVDGERHNALSRDLGLWMNSLGASEVLPLAEGDQESKDFDAIFSSWCFTLISKLKGYTMYETDGSSSGEIPTMNSPLVDPFDSDEEEGKVNFSDDDMLSDMSNENVEDVELDDYDDYMSNEDVGALNEITSPTTGTKIQDNEGKIVEEDTIVYVLLGHTKDISEKSDVFSVASLYRFSVRAKDKTKNVPVFPLPKRAGLKPEDDPIVSAQPLGLPIFSFTSDKYPIGMGCAALGCKLFFIGGYYNPSNSDTRDCLKFGNSNKMYILDTSAFEGLTTEQDISKIIQIKNSVFVSKYDPIVEVVHGKLFVLPNNFGSNGSNPTIESYDPIKDKWEIFDILTNYKGCGSLKTHPPVSPMYKVQAHFVKDSTIFIYLCTEVYAFTVDTGELILIGCHIRPEPPFKGMGVYSDGHYLVLDHEISYIYAYNFIPYDVQPGKTYDSRRKQRIYEISLFAAQNMHGVIRNFGDSGQEKRLLVSRIGHVMDNGQVNKELYLSLDFLKVGLVKLFEKVIHKCRTYHSVTYRVNCQNISKADIKGCFPM